jgi:folylpolyglutamate synthase/dihydropteroate synthase
MLGDTVEEIARNKGGIFKEGVPALAVVQEKSAKRGEGVLRDRAEELEVSRFGVTVSIGEELMNSRMVSWWKGVVFRPCAGLPGLEIRQTRYETLK